FNFNSCVELVQRLYVERCDLCHFDLLCILTFAMRRFSILKQPLQEQAKEAWESLRPSSWHPIATMEQSMHELKGFGRRKILKAMNNVPGIKAAVGEEDFFSDLPSDSKEVKSGEAMPFTTYSYSSAVVLDDDGNRIASIRRRYEDSSGRLKAFHSREIGDKNVTISWNRSNFDDKGNCETQCNHGTPEDFEKLWESTEFGQAVKELEKDKAPKTPSVTADEKVT
ncbi:hypothetical protein THRCLA_12015, partial [Thraustotheca clavata]